MSIHIVAFRFEDETYKKNKAIFLNCQEKGLSIPDQIDEYFGFADTPQEALKVPLKKGEHYELYDGDMREGFDIKIMALPENIETLRVYVSY